MFDWAIKLLEQGLIDIYTFLQDDEVKKDKGRVNENRIRYHQVKAAIKELKEKQQNDNNSKRRGACTCRSTCER